MSKDQAVAGSSTLLERSDFDVGAGQGGQGCGESEGGQASAAESSCYRLHCECAKEVIARRSGVIKSLSSFWASSCPLYICYTIRHPTRVRLSSSQNSFYAYG